ncbi:MAG: hypothetical protein JRG74_09670 [Deltaproteobacteria bacterium]|nr:hypothetical protein [Deltaproteobacteria bacterium]
MNNRIGFKLISLIVATIFCLQGCIWKTISVNEQMRELSRKPAEIGREYKIDLVSQSSVRVYEKVKAGHEVKYEVIDVKRKGRATGGYIVEDILLYRLIALPIVVVFTFGIGLVLAVTEENFWYLGRFQESETRKLPCPGPGCPIEKTIIEHKGTTIKHENINYKEIPVTSGNVVVYINGKHRTDIPIDSDGIAKFNFGLYPVDLKGIDEIEVKYKYKEAVASTFIPSNVYAEAIKKHSLPCALKASFELSDDQGHMPNGAIDAAEEVYIKVKIKNSGEGSAYGVVLVAESDNRFIKMPSRTMVGEIAPGESKTINIAVSGDVNLPTDKVNLKLYAEEERGYGSNTEILTVDTRAMIPTGLEIVSHRILDGKAGFAKGNSNGIVENGETFELEIFVKNNGRGEAKEVTLNL